MPRTIYDVPDPESRSTVFHPALVAIVGTGYRLSILQQFGGQTRTSAELAELLGVKRQSLNYHLEELGAAGWIEIVETVVKRGQPERVWAETRQVDWASVVATLNDLAGDAPRDTVSPRAAR